MTEIWGTTPEHSLVFLKIRPYWASAVTPSWMRAPPESRRAMIGIRRERARSMRRRILSPSTCPRVPPWTEKSWAYTATGRESIVPAPVMTAEARAPLSMSPPAKRSSSVKEPSSRSSAMRSRAVRLPWGCWRERARSSAASTTSRLRAAKFSRETAAPSSGRSCAPAAGKPFASVIASPLRVRRGRGGPRL